MKQWQRNVLAVLVCGPLWYGGLYVFFVYSGAQQILANPQYQSQKFIDSFVTFQPLPRMALDAWLVPKGLMITGTLLGLVLVYLNDKIKLGWFTKGLVFGLMSWALIIPWFEFYLPYNVMHEPMALVLLEALLWLCVMTCIGITISFVLNFRKLKAV